MAIKAKKEKTPAQQCTPRKGLDAVLGAICNKFGKTAINKGLEKIEKAGIGILGYDVATRGGIALGKIIEIYGMESSGKTTLNLAIGAAMQRRNKTTAYIDAEHALDAEYMKTLGYDVEKALISQPENGEMALEILSMLLDSGEVHYSTVDSVAALTPKKEIEGDMGDHNVGVQAKLMSQALRKTIASASKNKSTVCYINQLREKIGVMFGSPEVTTAGKALQFYASTRAKTRISGKILDGDDQVGVEITILFVKNKNASPGKEIVLRILFGYGYDAVDSLLQEAILCGVVSRAGSWIEFPCGAKSQGLDKARLEISTNKELTVNLINATVERLILLKKLPEEYRKDIPILIDTVMDFKYYRDKEENRLITLNPEKIKGDVQEDVVSDYDSSVEFLGEEEEAEASIEVAEVKPNKNAKTKKEEKTKGQRGRPKKAS